MKSSWLASGELNRVQERENIFKFLSSVMVFHKVLIELDSISMKVYFMYAVKNYETLEASYLMFYNPQKGISNIPAIEI